MMAGPRTVLATSAAPSSITTRPSTLDAASTSPWTAGSSVLGRGRVPPIEGRVADAVAVVDQPLDGVGDLQLAPVGRLDRGDGLVDGGVEQVDAHEGEVGRGLVGL